MSHYIQCPDFVASLVRGLFDEAERIYWNRHQQQINLGANDGNDGDLFGEVFGPEMTYRAYYWCIEYREDMTAEQIAESDRPNFSFDGVELSWYKHFGRGMSLNTEKTNDGWVAWFDKAMEHIRSKDIDMLHHRA